MNKRNAEAFDYPLKNIPAPLWNAFRDKCAAHQPPITMRYAILALIKKFVDHTPKHKPKSEAAKRYVKHSKTVRERIKRQKAEKPAPPVIEAAPDLGNLL